MDRRRASRNITLVLIGTAALAGCEQPPPKMARDHYASIEDWLVLPSKHKRLTRRSSQPS